MTTTCAAVTQGETEERSGEADPPPRRAGTPVRALLPHRASLDGLRGAAVAGVFAYHLGWLRGGFLGVSLFFTLSGFLITNLLLTERSSTGRIHLGAFWARRARRLLPAALGGIALAILVTAIAGTPEQLRALPGDVLGALAYAGNWRFVLHHSAYADGFVAPSPLLHYWSLAIEEQLYLVIPLVVVAAGGRRRLRMATGMLLVVSAGATLLLAGRTDPNRAYFGTDTRMFELLIGVGLAAVIGFPGRRPRGAALWRFVGVAAALATVVLWANSRQSDPWLYRGGLWCVALLSAGLILAACAEGGLSRLLEWRPLVALGRISYGVYVYHWPLLLLLDRGRTGLAGIPLAAVRIGATLAVAGASYRWLEQPIRRQRGRLPRPAILLTPLIPAALLAVAVIAVSMANGRAVAPAGPMLLRAASATGIQVPGRLSSVRGAESGASAPGAATSPPSVTTIPAARPLQRVLFVGDSLVFNALPTLADRLKPAGVTVDGVGGFGQSLMSHRAAWLAEISQAVSTFDPDVVVLESCCGPFKGDPPWVAPDGTPAPADSQAFYAEWRRLALQTSQLASTRGALVLWVLAPATHTNGWYGPIDGRVPVVNQIYSSLAGCGPANGFVDWTVFNAPDGSFAASVPDVNGQLVRIRHPDGFHFTLAGIAGQADVTLAEIQRQWAAAGGRPGPWSDSCTATAAPSIATSHVS